jgi:quercetin dioxygenase-like cupin family protein
MKSPAAFLLPLALLACSPEQQTQEAQAQSTSSEQGADKMEISRNDTRQPTQGPAQYFTGKAMITPLFDPKGPSQVGAALVAFEPGARTAWHTHPRGQRLVVTAGSGLTQVESGPIEEIRKGDVIWCPPNVRHWHGASPDASMTHIAIQESANGSPVTWLEHVTDEQYAQSRTG